MRWRTAVPAPASIAEKPATRSRLHPENSWCDPAPHLIATARSLSFITRRFPQLPLAKRIRRQPQIERANPSRVAWSLLASSSYSSCFTAYASAAFLNHSGKSVDGCPASVCFIFPARSRASGMTPSLIHFSAAPREPSVNRAASVASWAEVPRAIHSFLYQLPHPVPRTARSGTGCELSGAKFLRNP